MSEYPTWYCPVVFCTYSTSYKLNIRKHLEEVHNWKSEDIKNQLKIFKKARIKNYDTIKNNKLQNTDDHDKNTTGRC